MLDVKDYAKIGWIENKDSFAHSPILDRKDRRGQTDAKQSGK